jgi:hypothetical protein
MALLNNVQDTSPSWYQGDRHASPAASWRSLIYYSFEKMISLIFEEIQGSIARCVQWM